MAKRNWQKSIWKWHKRLGIMSALVLVFLSLTGVLLNHTHQIGLDKKRIASPTLLSLYGVTLPEFKSFRHGEFWLTAAGRTLYLEGKELFVCDHRFVGLAVLQTEQIFVFACSQLLYLYTFDYQLIEKVSQFDGLPTPVSDVMQCENSLCLGSGGRYFVGNLDELSWKQIDKKPKNVHSVIFEATSDEVKNMLLNTAFESGFSWERFVLDLHAGRFLGRVGPYVMDFMALLFTIIAATGTYMWLKNGQKKRKKRAYRHRKKALHK